MVPGGTHEVLPVRSILLVLYLYHFTLFLYCCLCYGMLKNDEFNSSSRSAHLFIGTQTSTSKVLHIGNLPLKIALFITALSMEKSKQDACVCAVPPRPQLTVLN